MERWVLLAALLAVGCGIRQKWSGGPDVRSDILAREISPDLSEEPTAADVPDIPPPGQLRPCCAFGAGLHVSLMSIAVPVFEMGNVIGVGDLGPHKYDNGAYSLEGSRPGAAPFNDEHNGLVYTCRGGFIDTAHLRDWADWTLYLGASLGRTMETGTTIPLHDEGGQRHIVTRPVPPELLAQVGRRDLAVPMAQWLAFQMSVWHEIATWYGWAAIPIFPEKASAFSPEDLYSNLLGIKIAGVLIYQYAVTSEVSYNESMNTAIARLLKRYGAVSAESGRDAAFAVDRLWWDSRVDLPSENLVRRRNMESGTLVAPWLVTDVPLSNEPMARLREECAGHDRPIALRNADACSTGTPYRDLATLEIEVGDEVASGFPFPRPGSRRITQDDFPGIIEHIRAENAVEFGPGADQPQ